MVEHLEGLLRTLDPEYDKRDLARANTTPFIESVWSDITPRPGQAQVRTADQSIMPGTLLDTPQQPHLPIHTTNENTKIASNAQVGPMTTMPVPVIPAQEGGKTKTKKEKQAQKQAEANQQAPKLRMPEATVPSTFQQTAGQMMPEAHVKATEPAVMSTPLMSMPEPSIPQTIPTPMPEAHLPPQEMPIPTVLNAQLPMPTSNVTLTNTPIPTIGAVVPPSTYDPDSLPAPTWTATQTPRTTGEGARSIAERNIYDRITTMLELLPLAHRNETSKEELAGLVMNAIGAEGIDRTHRRDQGAREDPSPPPLSAPANVGYPTYNDPYSATGIMTDNEWYQINGGGPLPPGEYITKCTRPLLMHSLFPGWTARFDYEAGLWYFCNYNEFPPTATWHDPRNVVGMPAMLTVPTHAPIPSILPAAPPPPAMPISMPRIQPPIPVTRQDADWLSASFGALQAQKEVVDGSRGVVSAELQREERESKELKQAIEASREAVDRANAAIAKGDAAKYQIAQEDMIRARGTLDRLSHEAQLRNALVPPALINYQGINRGFDHDPAYLRLRTYYTNERLPYYSQQIIPPACMPPGPGMPYSGMTGAATSFSGRIMGKLVKPKIPNSTYMPTAWPIPPAARFKASSTPTPYSMPEFCFAWDMLLRSRRDPYAAAAMRY